MNECMECIVVVVSFFFTFVIRHWGGWKSSVCSSRWALDLSPVLSMTRKAERWGLSSSLASSWGQPWGRHPRKKGGWAAPFLQGHCGLAASLLMARAPIRQPSLCSLRWRLLLSLAPRVLADGKGSPLLGALPLNVFSPPCASLYKQCLCYMPKRLIWGNLLFLVRVLTDKYSNNKIFLHDPAPTAHIGTWNKSFVSAFTLPVNDTLW